MTKASGSGRRRQSVDVGVRGSWATTVGVLLAFASVPMVLSETTIAVPSIAHDLGGSGFALNWVVAGYFLTASALMLVTGHLADIIVRRRMFGIGAAFFGSGALGSALAVNIVMLDLARTVSGIGSVRSNSQYSPVRVPWPGLMCCRRFEVNLAPHVDLRD